jgi:hypothetical protein
MQRPHIAKISLIIGLAAVFAVFGIGKFTDPATWIGFIPLWMDGLLGMTREQWLPVIGATEVVFAIMVLIPHDLIRRIGAAFMALHIIPIILILGVTGTGFDFNDLVMRDFGLLMASVALAVL